MNENTVVAICGYAGDANQIAHNMPYYLHHKCPTIVLSPEDSKIAKVAPSKSGVLYGFAGKRAYIGWDSLERQRLQLKLLLERFPQNHFLIHDSDSVCLSSALPFYLYHEPDVVWNNLVIDNIHERPADHPLPRIALQPPYFLSRKTIEAMLAVAGQIVMDPLTPFIDHYMLQLSVAANLPYKKFPDGGSCGTGDPHGEQVMTELIEKSGVIFVHSVKRADVLIRLARARLRYLKAAGVSA